MTLKFAHNLIKAVFSTTSTKRNEITNDTYLF